MKRKKYQIIITANVSDDESELATNITSYDLDEPEVFLLLNRCLTHYQKTRGEKNYGIYPEKDTKNNEDHRNGS